MRMWTRKANRSAGVGSPAASWLRLLVVAGACATAYPFSVSAQSPPQSSEKHVIIRQMHFEPSTLNVKTGETIEWKNQDIFTHTVTANDGSFDSGPISPGSSWQMTVRKSGATAYHCRPHPNMTAQLVAEQAGDEQHGHNGAEGTVHDTLRWSPPARPEQIHPILVNFTAALLPLALLSDLLGRLLRRNEVRAVGLWLIVYEAAVSPFTVIAGWWWKNTEPNQLPAKLITVHQWLGTAAALLFILLAVWRWRLHRSGASPGWTYLFSLFIAVVALVYQGSLGGLMVFDH